MMKMNQRKIRRVEARVFIWLFCHEEDGRIGSKREQCVHERKGRARNKKTIMLCQVKNEVLLHYFKQ